MAELRPDPDERRPPPGGAGQCAQAVLMVRPAAFGWNPATAASNRFQHAAAAEPGAIARAAREEFDGAVAALSQAGLRVHVFDDPPEPPCPDAVFPNNWVSFHDDGTVVIYPMLAANRRRERRLGLLPLLERQGPYAVRRVVDLTHYEAQGRFLEGTGSLVLDRVDRMAYACLSPRTDREPLAEFCEQCGYEPFTFSATDAAGVPVYHTNVVLSLGRNLAVLAAEAVAGPDRERLLERLAARGRELITIDRDQAAGFAANVLELRAASGASVLALSTRAFESLGALARERIATRVDRLVPIPIPTIESVGGGSVRCMLAEVFLPRKEAL
ncbi:MAG TPA: arginine deiminase-related protein [Steroidobacteraceae bacterium]|nr:arginine deiminase-related protein [Steroidobacteraceae bacterium]